MKWGLAVWANTAGSSGFRVGPAPLGNCRLECLSTLDLGLPKYPLPLWAQTLGQHDCIQLGLEIWCDKVCARGYL